MGEGRALGAEHAPDVSAYVSTYEIVATFPHDGYAFTQGLAFDDAGNLFESDGLYRQSAVRHVHVQDGRSTHHKRNEASHFGEGIAIVGSRLLQLTWQERVVNEYSLPNLDLVATHRLPCANGQDTQPTRCAEGWGLAYDGVGKLYLTDSTDKLFFLDPVTLKST